LYVEDLKRNTNKDIGPKDIFEMGSCYYCQSDVYLTVSYSALWHMKIINHRYVKFAKNVVQHISFKTPRLLSLVFSKY
jgi:hypothetical protein